MVPVRPKPEVSEVRRDESAVLSAIIDPGVRELYPGYFALVMATGIVSIACAALGLPWAARPLFYLNVVAYVTLWALFACRLLRFPRDMLADLSDHVRGPGFFTSVAATCILGNQFLVIAGSQSAAVRFWYAATVLWTGLMYGFFAAITIREPKPDLGTGLHGGWLLVVVATQAVSLLGSLVAGRFGSGAAAILFFTLCMYLLGCMLYVMVISLIFYRWTFFSLRPAALRPPYWINMGAVAITTRAGATLVASVHRWNFLNDIQPFLKGFTLFFWATGTWWIPLLIILTAWRHLRGVVPVRYDPQYWGMVFPLGMYTVATLQLSRMTGLAFLVDVAHACVWVALGAWVIVTVGFVRSMIESWRLAGPGVRQPRQLSER